MKSLSAKTFQCGVTVQGLTTLSGTVYLTALTNTATWDYVVVGTTAQGQLYTRTYAQLMSDITSGIGLSGYVPTSRTLTINGVSYDLTANRSWTITTPYVSKLQHTVKAGVAINKGQAVYVTSADGTNMIVGLASNASEATSSKTMGLLDATVSTNGFANVVTEGLLAGLDTSTAGAAGDPVWLGTGGNLIYGLLNKPYAPAHLVFIGIVTRKNASNGEIFVKVQNGFELNEIHDVDLKTNLPVNGELLGFNGTLWVNKTIAGWLGYTPANASGTTNYISKFTGSTTLGNSLVFDNGTNVGIGTVTPDSRLHIEGNTTGSGSGADAIVHIKQNGGWNGNEPWALYVEGYSYLNGFRVNAYDTQRGLYSDAGELGFAVGGNSPISFTQNTSDYRMYIAPGGNIGIGTTSPGYKLEVNGTGYFANNLKLQTGILSFDGVSGYWGNAIKYETGQLNLYQSGDLHLGVGGNNITLYKNTKIPHNQRFTAGGYSDTDGITVWGTQNASAGGDGFIGRNLYYNGTNYIYASTNDNNLWGTIAGMRVVGSGSNALEFIARPATNSGLNVVASDLDSYKRMVISYSGNVGIGTTTPPYKLSVLTTGTLGFSLTTYNSTVGNPQIDLYDATRAQETVISSTDGTTVGTYLASFTNHPLLFGTYAASTPTARMAILPSGNVGIGITNPGSKLDVNGGSDVTVAKFYNLSATATQVEIGDSGNSQYSDLIFQSNSGTAEIWKSGTGYTGYGGASALNIFTSNGAIAFHPSNVQNSMFIATSGNVGIGITTPSALLHIAKNATYNNVSNTALRVANVTSPNKAIDFGYDNTADVGYIQGIEFGVAAKNLSLQSDGGNVGIGTITPTTKLHVVGTVTATAIQLNTGSGDYYINGSSNILRIGSLSTTNKIQLELFHSVNPVSLGISYNGGEALPYIESVHSSYDVNTHLLFKPGGTENWRIGSHGSNHIYGSAFAIKPASNNYDFYLANSSGTALFYSDTSTGNIGIGTTSPSYKLQVNADGAGLYVLGANTAPYTQTIASFVYGGNGNSINIENQGGKASIQARAGGSTMDLLLNPAGSNVVIGTTTPFTIGGTAKVSIYADAPSTYGLSSTDAVYLRRYGVGEYQFQTTASGGNSGNLSLQSYGGSVGIGTTSPAQKLDVAGGDIILSSNATYIRSKDASGNSPRMFGINPSNDTYIGPIDPYAGGAVFYGVSANVSSQTFYTGANARIHITSGGNVGIGTSSPGYKLSVAASGNSYNVGPHSAGVDLYSTGNIAPHYQTNYWWFTGVPGAGTFRMGLDASGNLGIGTSTPGYKLDVFGSARVSDTLFINTTANRGKLNIAGYDNGGINIIDQRTASSGIFYSSITFRDYYDSVVAASIDFYHNQYFGSGVNRLGFSFEGSERLTILRSGNVGIGTTSPVSPLDVNGIISSRGIFIAQNNGTYNIIYNASNSVAMYLGGSGDQNNYYDNNSHFFRNAGGGTTFGRWTSTGLGIGTTSPTTPLHVMGIVQVEGGGSTTFYGTDASGSYARNFGTQLYTFRDAGGSIITSINTTSGVITTTGGNSTNWNTAYGWGNHSSAGYVPQARTLTINGTSYDLSANRSWTIATTTPGGSNTQFQYNNGGSLAGASALTYNSTTNRVGVNQASPGYDFDVNGQVRVQDKLRVGTVNSGNGVVHMSSSATINPSATTIVWAQNVSVGMCAFIEYYILNNNSLTDQRAGTIMVTWNQSGTPTIAHTETTTPDIGSTIAVNFTSSLVGSDARINAVNSSANPYTIVMSYKYF